MVEIHINNQSLRSVVRNLLKSHMYQQGLETLVPFKILLFYHNIVY